jgi:hypothetical protein
MVAVETFCEATGYPANRFDDRVGAADLLLRLSGIDPYQMGRLLAGAVPTVPPAVMRPDTGPGLAGGRRPAGSAGLVGPAELGGVHLRWFRDGRRQAHRVDLPQQLLPPDSSSGQ